jgi:hypothetical protein
MNMARMALSCATGRLAASRSTKGSKMDDSRFDDIAREVARLPQSRRAAVRLLAGSLAGAVLGGVGHRATPVAAGLCSPSHPPRTSCPIYKTNNDGTASVSFVCVDLQTDNSHCGTCNTPCGAATCQVGVCTCPTSGRTLCNGRCVDTQTSAAHCGGCNRWCGRCGRNTPVNQCVAGVCSECPIDP